MNRDKMYCRAIFLRAWVNVWRTCIMASMKSRLIYFVMRNRHLLKFKLHRDAWDFNTSIPAFRETCEAGAKKAERIPASIEIIPAVIDGLPAGLAAEWIRPSGIHLEQMLAGPVQFYVHGGGYVSGSCSDHRGFVSKLVAGSGIPALLYEYRLAPEHPFPAAMDDTLTAYAYLLAQGVSAQRVVVLGDSAGGGLALALLLALRGQGDPLPAAAVAMSPWTDLKRTGKPNNVKGALEPEGMGAVCSKYYCGDNDPTLPLISPLYGDLRGLPPMSIYVGGAEGLLDDAVRFADKARQAGVDVTFHIGEAQEHCYPLLAGLFPEADEAMAEICAYMNEKVNPGML